MANFKLICRILDLLDSYLDDEEPDWSKLSAANFHVTEKRFVSIIAMLLDAGYISGIVVIPQADRTFGLKLKNPSITLKGMEYLESNSTVNKAYRILRGIKEITPGM